MGFGSILGGIASAVGGSLVSGVFNARESDKNRDFQLDASNTAHQREIADLKAAGLNPILSSKYGGSSTPSGSAASISAPDIAGAVNSARQTSQQGSLIKAQILQSNSAAALNAANARQVAVNTALDTKYGPAERLGRGDAWKVYAATKLGDAAQVGSARSVSGLPSYPGTNVPAVK